jgi:hypothetical protein
MRGVLYDTCECCQKKDKTVKTQQLNNRMYWLCAECLLSLQWTQSCLKLGTEKILKDFPEKYKRVSKFSVTAIE